MTCCSQNLDYVGADPVSTKWSVVRGDTSSIRIEFYDTDEVTYLDTSTWTFLATAYNKVSDTSDILEVTPGNGYVDIIAASDVTETWGTGIASVVAELAFDLQVTIGDIVWTPVLGTIAVLGDVTGGVL